MEQSHSETFDEIVERGKKLMANDCKCLVCQEHDPSMRRMLKSQKRYLAIFALFLICLFSWVSYQTGSMNASLKLQREAVERGLGAYKPQENWRAFKWKD